MNRSFFILSVIVTMSTVLLATIGLLTSCGGVDSSFLPLPSDFLLSSPSDSSVVGGTTPTLVWTDATGEDQYHAQISDVPTFASNFDYTMTVNWNTTSFTVPTFIRQILLAGSCDQRFRTDDGLQRAVQFHDDSGAITVRFS